LYHFYKKDGQWVTVSDKEYEEKRDELPIGCFATNVDLEELNLEVLPDFDLLQTKIDETSEDHKVNYVYYKTDENSKVTLDELKLYDSSLQSVEPKIYIRTSRPIKPEVFTIPLGEVEFFGMNLNYEDYCKTNNIDTSQKKPGKLPYLDSRKAFKNLEYEEGD
jgi:hypothetical protein